MTGAATWQDALAALALFAVDPAGLQGIVLRSPAGPVRDRFLALLRGALPPGAAFRRMPPGIDDDRLLGGLDLAVTLQAGRPVAQRGLLAEADGGVVVLAMAERIEPGAAARLCAALDTGAVGVPRDGLAPELPARFGLVALDEGIAPDEAVPNCLLDRTAFHVDLSGIAPRDMADAGWTHADLATGRQRLNDAATPVDAPEVLCRAAAALGIDSARAPLLALRAARAAAALAGRSLATEPDLAIAARLVLAPRATRLPPPDQPAANDPSDPFPGEPADDAAGDDRARCGEALGEVVLAAVRAALPAGLLAGLARATAAPPKSRAPGRAGQSQASLRRGRPIGTRQGEPRSGARLHVLDTLKAAAAWQSLRRRPDAAAAVPRIELRRSDFRIVRLRQRSRTTTVFAVDASGSAALHRLAEAKGAVELLLADCYVRRDEVALIAFRGCGADLLLPPTRSLPRARRCVAGLPGGGTTPLAAGIEAAVTLAGIVRRSGRTAVIALLTDGRANVARDGTASRAQGEADALASARLALASGLAALLIDTSPRPNPFARRLAETMHARYLALPHADAASLSRAVRSAAAA